MSYNDSYECAVHCKKINVTNLEVLLDNVLKKTTMFGLFVHQSVCSFDLCAFVFLKMMFFAKSANIEITRNHAIMFILLTNLFTLCNG